MPSISTENIHLGNSKAIAQYVKSISMNNRKTGVQYAARLRNFASYFSKTYNFTIDDLLIKKTFKIDVYELLSNYAFYLTSEYVSSDGFKLSNITIKNIVNTIRNFLEYHDIDINPRKYKLKIRHPKVVRQHKEALTKEDIAKILQACVTPKLRIFVHFLAVTGCRASEACAVRLMDFDLINSKVFIRGEYTKTRTDRYVFLTSEFIEQLQEYLKYKYRKRIRYYEPGKEPTVIIPQQKDTNLLFASYFYNSENENQVIDYIYNNLVLQFEKTLDVLRIPFENNSTKRRRKITFHSFRRFVKSVISDLGYSDFSEWYIGHLGSTYYRRSDKDKFELFKKIEPYLTFLDQTGLEIRSRDLQSRLEAMETENKELRDKDSMNADAIASLSDKMHELTEKIQKLENLR
jgi:integrase